MNEPSTEKLEIKKSTLEKVADDPVKSAKLYHLVYIGKPEPGITRKNQVVILSIIRTKKK